MAQSIFALISKKLNKQIFLKQYHLSNLFELVDSIVLTISGHKENIIFQKNFSSVDRLKTIPKAR